MLRTWNLTVFSLTPSCLASLRFEVMPLTSSSRTSRSRSVSASGFWLGGGARDGRANSWRSLRARAGVSAGSPRLTPSSRLKKSSRFEVLEQVSLGPRLDRLEEIGVVVGGGQDHHLDLGLLGADQPGGGEPVDLGHREVHQDDVGLELAGELDGLAAVPRLGRRPRGRGPRGGCAGCRGTGHGRRRSGSS